MHIYTHTHSHIRSSMRRMCVSVLNVCCVDTRVCMCICAGSSPASDSFDEEEEDVKLAEMKKRSQTTHYTLPLALYRNMPQA